MDGEICNDGGRVGLDLRARGHARSPAAQRRGRAHRRRFVLREFEVLLERALAAYAVLVARGHLVQLRTARGRHAQHYEHSVQALRQLLLCALPTPHGGLADSNSVLFARRTVVVEDDILVRRVEIVAPRPVLRCPIRLLSLEEELRILVVRGVALGLRRPKRLPGGPVRRQLRSGRGGDARGPRDVGDHGYATATRKRVVAADSRHDVNLRLLDGAVHIRLL
mmetsp:Transcript_8660/g.35307  ORF Transcript_8660/g.35307 Transcript_8660/m.35307 type:complete len:223 (-) Transcript_8660:1020-1688(-)